MSVSEGGTSDFEKAGAAERCALCLQVFGEADEDLSLSRSQAISHHLILRVASDDLISSDLDRLTL